MVESIYDVCMYVCMYTSMSQQHPQRDPPLLLDQTESALQITLQHLDVSQLGRNALDKSHVVQRESALLNELHACNSRDHLGA